MTSCVAIAQLSTGRKTFKQATSAADGYVRARSEGQSRRPEGQSIHGVAAGTPRWRLGPSSGNFQGAGTREKVTTAPELIPARLRSSAAFMDFPG